LRLQRNQQQPLCRNGKTLRNKSYLVVDRRALISSTNSISSQHAKELSYFSIQALLWNTISSSPTDAQILAWKNRKSTETVSSQGKALFMERLFLRFRKTLPFLVAVFQKLLLKRYAKLWTKQHLWELHLSDLMTLVAHASKRVLSHLQATPKSSKEMSMPLDLSLKSL
jgi:hypothetical protein